ncbi:MAG: hypothetical protein QM622_00290 [Microbacterium sp.]
MNALTESPTLSALHEARRLLARAISDAADLRRRVAAIAAATDWRSRAADGYRAALADLAADVDTLMRLIDASDGDLAARELVETARLIGIGQ